MRWLAILAVGCCTGIRKAESPMPVEPIRANPADAPIDARLLNSFAPPEGLGAMPEPCAPTFGLCAPFVGILDGPGELILGAILLMSFHLYPASWTHLANLHYLSTTLGARFVRGRLPLQLFLVDLFCYVIIHHKSSHSAYLGSLHRSACVSSGNSSPS